MKVAAAFFFCAACVLPAAVHAAPLKNTLEVSGWLPYWRGATTTSDVIPHLKVLTAIHPFGYIVQNDGVLYDPMGVADDPWKTLRTLAVQNKVRVIPTIMWSNGDAIHAILSKSTTRQKLEDDIADLIKREGFDGVDIDFENKYAKTSAYFSLFLKGLYSRIGNKWLYCTIEARTPIDARYEGTPPPDAGQYANDFTQINKYCDRVQIMAYDQGSIDVQLNATATGPYVPVADIAWVEKVMKLAAQTISKKKLILGIPSYGYEYGVQPLTEQGFRYTRLWSFNPAYALAIASQFDLTPTRGPSGELSLMYIPTSTPRTAGVPTSSNAVGPAAAVAQPFNVLWWEDEVAVAQKIALAKKLGLRGVAIFKFDGGEDQRIWNLFY